MTLVRNISSCHLSFKVYVVFQNYPDFCRRVKCYTEKSITLNRINPYIFELDFFRNSEVKIGCIVFINQLVNKGNWLILSSYI